MSMMRSIKATLLTKLNYGDIQVSLEDLDDGGKRLIVSAPSSIYHERQNQDKYTKYYIEVFDRLLFKHKANRWNSYINGEAYHNILITDEKKIFQAINLLEKLDNYNTQQNQLSSRYQYNKKVLANLKNNITPPIKPGPTLLSKPSNCLEPDSSLPAIGKGSSFQISWVKEKSTGQQFVQKDIDNTAADAEGFAGLCSKLFLMHQQSDTFFLHGPDGKKRGLLSGILSQFTDMADYVKSINRKITRQELLTSEINGTIDKAIYYL